MRDWHVQLYLGKKYTGKRPPNNAGGQEVNVGDTSN